MGQSRLLPRPFSHRTYERTSYATPKKSSSFELRFVASVAVVVAFALFFLFFSPLSVAASGNAKLCGRTDGRTGAGGRTPCAIAALSRARVVLFAVFAPPPSASVHCRFCSLLFYPLLCALCCTRTLLTSVLIIILGVSRDATSFLPPQSLLTRLIRPPTSFEK